MRLEGDFYKTEHFESDPAGFRAVVSLNPYHPIYAGHFPSQPVVPGVCTMTVVRELAGRALGCKVRFASVKESKFVSAVIPDGNLRLKFDFAIEADLKITGTVFRCDGGGETAALKLKAMLTR